MLLLRRVWCTHEKTRPPGTDNVPQVHAREVARPGITGSHAERAPDSCDGLKLTQQ